MSAEPDHTLPGPAGLFFRTDQLSAAGWHQEHQARSRLERWCSNCGQSACYGFGETLKTEGVLSCADPECRAAAERAVAQRDCPSPPAKPINPNSEPDLFGESA